MHSSLGHPNTSPSQLLVTVVATLSTCIMIIPNLGDTVCYGDTECSNSRKCSITHEKCILVYQFANTNCNFVSEAANNLFLEISHLSLHIVSGNLPSWVRLDWFSTIQLYYNCTIIKMTFNGQFLCCMPCLQNLIF